MTWMHRCDHADPGAGTRDGVLEEPSQGGVSVRHVLALACRESTHDPAQGGQTEVDVLALFELILVHGVEPRALATREIHEVNSRLRACCWSQGLALGGQQAASALLALGTRTPTEVQKHDAMAPTRARVEDSLADRSRCSALSKPRVHLLLHLVRFAMPSREPHWDAMRLRGPLLWQLLLAIQEVVQLVVIHLQKTEVDGKPSKSTSFLQQSRQHVDRPKSKALVLPGLEGPKHGVGLAAASLSIGQDGRIVALHTALKE
mmetsp:Transcript_78301/g.203515  ORF Transcript_78301/g.203515 Transcript_78301/m.203515 type:complete len:261 (-) Transcript_78301:253-1035(-)